MFINMAKLTKDSDLENMRAAIIAMLLQMTGSDVLELDSPIRVRVTPHTPDLLIYRLQTNACELHASNGEGWWQLEPGDKQYRHALPSVHQRVRHIHQQVNTKEVAL
jgi:hypothetical protein